MVPKSRNKGLQRREGQEEGGCDMDKLETEGQECSKTLIWCSGRQRDVGGVLGQALPSAVVLAL